MSLSIDGNPYDELVLHELRVAIAERLGPYAADRLQVQYMLDHMAYEVATSVLAEQLPTERITERRHERIETVRFATWWDHFKATHRGRWWMRWRRWDIRQLVDEHILEATATVDLTRYWAFPRAAVAAPELGAAVRVMQYAHVDERGQPNRVYRLSR